MSFCREFLENERNHGYDRYKHKFKSYKLDNMLKKLLKKELIKFHQWLSDEINDAYDEIIVDEYLQQYETRLNELGKDKGI